MLIKKKRKSTSIQLNTPDTMTRQRTLLLLTIVCIFAARLSARPHFEHIDTHGHTVFCICRDAEGVVWAGTSNGLTTLAQLQGDHPFSYVRHEALNDQIATIEEDMTGRLWLLTYSNRILVYDARRNHVITDVPAYLKQLGMPYGNEQAPHVTVFDASHSAAYVQPFSWGLPLTSNTFILLSY